MGRITKEEVLKLAKLSKLSLTDEEVDKYQKEFEALLEYIDQLQSVDTEGLEPTNQVTGLHSVMRSDEIKENVPKEQLLKNAPSTEGNLIKVRRVLE